MDRFFLAGSISRGVRQVFTYCFGCESPKNAPNPGGVGARVATFVCLFPGNYGRFPPNFSHALWRNWMEAGALLTLSYCSRAVRVRRWRLRVELLIA